MIILNSDPDHVCYFNYEEGQIRIMYNKKRFVYDKVSEKFVSRVLITNNYFVYQSVYTRECVVHVTCKIVLHVKVRRARCSQEFWN